MKGTKRVAPIRPSIEESSADRLQFWGAPALGASITRSTPPFIFSRVKNDETRPDQFFIPPVAEAFVFQIPLIPCVRPDIRYAKKQVFPQGVCEPGWSYLLDMSAGPTRRLDTTYDNASIYMHQSTIEELAYEQGRTSVGGIKQPTFGVRDPIMFRLAQAWLPILENPESASSLFVEHLALALYEHVITTCGSARSSSRRRGAGVAPWQMRRIKDFVEANLGANPSISDLARECNLSPSYFAEAFKRTTDISPHQWLLKRRVERAKWMLRVTDLSLASIASDCGFFDQSHFSRVFARFENCGPSDWRRYNRPC
jgi:AraC family transcriptional regulator